MYFESPDLLYLFAIVPIQAMLLWIYWQWRRLTLRRLGSPALEARLLQGFSTRRFHLKNMLFIGGAGLIVLAIASPVRIEKESGKTSSRSDIILALDVSNSMLAADVKPSRLEAAKNFIRQLMPALETERLGLVIFAGEAFPQMPLSTDAESFMMFVRNAQPDFITDQGTDIGAAVELGKRMLESAPPNGRAVVLISDGENHEEKALQRVREAREAGIQIITVTAGTGAAANVPGANGSPRRDGMGKPVSSSANPSFMQEVAQAGGGVALQLSAPDRTVESIKNTVARLEKQAVTDNATSKKIYYFPWLLLGAFLLFVADQMLWWKRKTAVLMLLLCGLQYAASAQSDHTALRKGQEQYEKGNYEKAEQFYRQSGSARALYNAGNAAYEQATYTDAVKYFTAAAEKSIQSEDKADALYNLGNALLKQGDYKAAVTAYEKSLRLAPGRPDAQKNLQIAKRPPQPPPPPTPPPPPPPPPPPSKPRQYYLDRAAVSHDEQMPRPMTPQEARMLLEKAVLAQEQRNAGAYRELSPANRPSRLKKDW